jgi:predicted permease
MGEIAAKAASLILIIVIGYVIKRIGWVSAADFPKFSKIILRITLPCALITSFNTFDITSNLLFLTAIGLLANLILQITGYLVNQRKGGIAQAFGIINLGSYNVGAFAMPYIAGLMGPQSIIFASLFDVGNSFGAAGIGYGWSRSVADEKQKTTLGGFLKLMFLSPLFDTYLILLLMRLLGLQLPDEVITFTSTVGGANTFLAMLMIGIGLELGLDAHRFKLAFKYLAIRYGFSLIFSILTVLFLPVSMVVKTILCMLFFSPIASMATGFTDEAGGDVETSAFMNSVSILIGIFALPLVLAVMG